MAKAEHVVRAAGAAEHQGCADRAVSAQDGVRQLPAALNLEDQSYFALGYRQMCTQMNADKSAAKAAKEEETENGRN